MLVAFATYVLAGNFALEIRNGLSRAPYVWLVEAGAAIAALVAFQALWSRSYPRARIAAAAQVGLIVIGWGLAQYPYLVRPELTIFNSASPPNILVDIEIAVALGAVILIPSLVLLLLIFKRDGKSISASVDKTVSEAFTRGELL
jgi:cytochrome bd ubiquinol oxidase subunit II